MLTCITLSQSLGEQPYPSLQKNQAALSCSPSPASTAGSCNGLSTQGQQICNPLGWIIATSLRPTHSLGFLSNVLLRSFTSSGLLTLS